VARYPLNQPVRLSTTVRDVTGTLVNAGTLTLVVKVRAASGTLTTTGTYASPANDGTGLYHQDVPAADLQTLGHYQYTWTATGTGAGVSFGDFDVFDPYETAVLPLQDAKDALNIAQAITTYDSEILAYVAVIQGALEALTGGPLTSKVITERAELDGTGTILIAQQRPVVSVTSITSVDSGIAADLTGGLDIDAGAGIIRAKNGGTLSAGSSPAVTLVYVAGWGATLPPAFGIASRIIIQRLWKTQHGPSARPSMGIEESAGLPGLGFAISQAMSVLNGSQDGTPFLAVAAA
jgi:hypothetical protein